MVNYIVELIYSNGESRFVGPFSQKSGMAAAYGHELVNRKGSEVKAYKIKILEEPQIK